MTIIQNLAATRSYHNLDVTVQSALSHRDQRPEGVTTCKMHETVETVAKRLVEAEVNLRSEIMIKLDSPDKYCRLKSLV